MSDKIVYSSEHGDLRDQSPSKKKKKKTSTQPAVKNDGVVRIRRETKGRGGKTVTALYGLPFKGDELSIFSKELKQKCGTGGTIKDGVIIIQGDNISKILQILESRGIKAKKSGG